MLKRISRCFTQLKISNYTRYLLIATTIYFVLHLVFELAEYRSFRIYTWDLGIFNQVFSSTLHGRFLYYTAEPYYTTSGCFLGTHFSPILLLILPFYTACPRPETLLVLGLAIASIGVIPAYNIAKHFLKDEKYAAIFGISYLLYPPVQGVVISGFSMETIAMTLSLFTLYYLVKGDFRTLSLFVILGLMTHEAVAVVMAFIGLYGLWYYHKSSEKTGIHISLLISVVSAAYYLFAEQMRLIFGWTGAPSLWHEWAIIGAQGPLELPFRLIMNPFGAWHALTYDMVPKCFFLLLLFLSFAFLPIIGVEGLIPATPYLFMSMFSAYTIYYSIEGHYGAFTAPFFFVAMLCGIVRLQRRFGKEISISRVTKLLLVCLVLLSMFSLRSYVKPEFLQFNTQHHNAIYELISYIPEDASVLTQSHIFPHLSNRIEAYTIPSPLWIGDHKKAAIEMLDGLNRSKVEYVLIDFKCEQYSAAAADLILNFYVRPNDFDLLQEKDGVFLYKQAIQLWTTYYCVLDEQ